MTFQRSRIMPFSPKGMVLLGRAAIATAAILALVGAYILIFHLTTDPLADVHAYYDAGSRLNAGQPLYPPGADPDLPGFYRYPPLLAIAFRPLALLPFGVAAGIWTAVTVAALGLTFWRLGIRRRRTWIAAGILAGPTAWAVSVGQAQVVTTLLVAIGSPMTVALAGQLKLLPVLVALYWIGRRDWRRLGSFVAWSIAFVVVQLVLEPAGSIAFLGVTNLGQVGQVNNFSPYAVSPLVWLILVVIGVLATLRLAPTRAGWATAVAFSVLATPRLLEYMLMTLLAAVRGPDDPDRQPDQQA